MHSFDLVVLGGGSGGLATAQRAAEYGARVALFEPNRLGGTCVNVGCVPKKVMWNAAELAAALEHAPHYGFDVAVGRHDWAKLKRGRDAYVARLNGIYQRNLDKKGIVDDPQGRATDREERSRRRRRARVQREAHRDCHGRDARRAGDCPAPSTVTRRTISSNGPSGRVAS